jgi:hypothetical protein
MFATELGNKLSSLKGAHDADDTAGVSSCLLEVCGGVCHPARSFDDHEYIA